MLLAFIEVRGSVTGFIEARGSVFGLIEAPGIGGFAYRSASTAWNCRNHIKTTVHFPDVGTPRSPRSGSEPSSSPHGISPTLVPVPAFRFTPVYSHAISDDQSIVFLEPSYTLPVRSTAHSQRHLPNRSSPPNCHPTINVRRRFTASDHSLTPSSTFHNSVRTE